ncbi:hypothetical protein JTB14_002174 [Gonioctena quinquepunctata]|nr:hypothetical protein JTB14_002174 [Gonioctena quinquepunctata]
MIKFAKVDLEGFKSGRVDIKVIEMPGGVFRNIQQYEESIMAIERPEQRDRDFHTTLPRRIRDPDSPDLQQSILDTKAACHLPEDN